MEFDYERITMSAALLAMSGAVIAKIVTMQLIKVMRKAIEVVNNSRLEAHRELSLTLSRKNVSDRDQVKLQNKRKKIQTQIRKLKGELAEFKKNESERRKQRVAVRGKLT